MMHRMKSATNGGFHDNVDAIKAFVQTGSVFRRRTEVQWQAAR
jgi:hypothetical protein